MAYHNGTGDSCIGEPQAYMIARDVDAGDIDMDDIDEPDFRRARGQRMMVNFADGPPGRPHVEELDNDNIQFDAHAILEANIRSRGGLHGGHGGDGMQTGPNAGGGEMPNVVTGDDLLSDGLMVEGAMIHVDDDSSAYDSDAIYSANLGINLDSSVTPHPTDRSNRDENGYISELNFDRIDGLNFDDSMSEDSDSNDDDNLSLNFDGLSISKSEQSIIAIVHRNDHIFDGISSEDMSMLSVVEEDNIEYDDDAIFCDNPTLEDDLRRHEQQNAIVCTKKPSFIEELALSNEPEDDKIDASTTKTVVQRRTDEILKHLRSKIKCIKATETNMAETRKIVDELKADYSALQHSVGKLENMQKQVVGAMKHERNTMELIAYQNSVLKNLTAAAEKMKIYQFYVTPDKQVCFFDPDAEGTDVDAL